MVGTIEPRKGHRVALAAFERLWREGASARFVIVGRRGWYEEAVVAAIEPIQQRYAQITADKSFVSKVLHEGAERVRPLAQDTVNRVKLAMGLPSS